MVLIVNAVYLQYRPTQSFGSLTPAHCQVILEIYSPPNGFWFSPKNAFVYYKQEGEEHVKRWYGDIIR